MFLVDHLMTKWIETKRLKVQPQRCVKTRNRFASCNKCSKACPVSAISLEKGLTIKEDVCTECMICTVTCPTDALSDEKYPQYFREMPNREMISFTCENDRSNGSHIKLACLAQLDKSLLINATNSSHNVTIQFHEERCKSCRKYNSHLKTILEDTINNLNTMLKEKIVINFNEKQNTKMERSYTRRDLFSFYSKKITNNVVTPLFFEEEETKNLRLSLETGTKQTIYQILLERHQNKFIEHHSASDLNTLQLSFTARCDGCKVCSTVCTTSALKFIEEEKEVKAIFSPSQCNGCMSCIDICKRDGIELNHSPVSLIFFLENNVQEVFKKEFKTCKTCGDKHLNSSSFCDDCTNKHKRFS